MRRYPTINRLEIVRYPASNAVVFFLLIAFTLFSCKGDKGDTGTPGAAGTNGNANVISKKFTITPGQWQTASSTDIYFDLTISEINQGILDNGLVMVYLESAGNEIALPVTNYSGSTSLTLGSTYTLNSLHIEMYSNSVVTIPSINYNLRAVIASGHVRLPKVNWNNFQEVKSTFGLN